VGKDGGKSSIKNETTRRLKSTTSRAGASKMDILRDERLEEMDIEYMPPKVDGKEE
jgi:hypothetical protein